LLNIVKEYIRERNKRSYNLKTMFYVIDTWKDNYSQCEHQEHYISIIRTEFQEEFEQNFNLDILLSTWFFKVLLAWNRCSIRVHPYTIYLLALSAEVINNIVERNR